MPFNVRAFWWINVALIAYSVANALWFLSDPTPFPAKVVAILGAQWVGHAQIVYGIQLLVITLLRGIIILTVAWFASFLHQPWARWASVVLLITSICLPVVVAMSLGMWRQTLRELSRELGNWRLILVMMLWALSLIFLFTGNARAWFRRPGEPADA